MGKAGLEAPRVRQAGDQGMNDDLPVLVATQVGAGTNIQYIDLPSDDEIVADLRALLAVDAIPEYAETARQWAELAGVKERPLATVLRALVAQGTWLRHTGTAGQARTFVYWPIKKDEQRE